jgi:hypothetical protein
MCKALGLIPTTREREREKGRERDRQTDRQTKREERECRGVMQ